MTEDLEVVQKSRDTLYIGLTENPSDTTNLGTEN